MITLLAQILKVLNSEQDPRQIAAALCLGCIFGLTPLWTLHNLLILLLVLVVRVNLTTFFVSWGVFTALAYMLDPLFDAIGYAVLTAEPLQAMWTAFYSTALGKLSDFNNTVVMGSLCVSLVLVPILFAATVYLVRRYRTHLLGWVRRTWLYEVVRGTRIFTIYQRLSG